MTFCENQVILIARRKWKKKRGTAMAGMLALVVLLVVTYLGGRIVLRCFHRTESFLAPAMVAGFVVLLLYMCMWQVVVL